MDCDFFYYSSLAMIMVGVILGICLTSLLFGLIFGLWTIGERPRKEED